MEKINMIHPLVELDGDEMTRVIWRMIKDELIFPYVELKTEYYDLGLPNRDKTQDQVTVNAGNAIKKHGVGVKCATITPNFQRMEEYKLQKMWKSPNGTIRGILDGTVLRAPLLVSHIKPAVKGWEKPITIARHAFGDLYAASEMRITKPGKAELVFTGEDGSTTRQTVCEYDSKGVLQALYNKDSSIRAFAHVCFRYALDTKQDLWFSTKDTISASYDQTFKLLFQEIFDNEYKTAYEKAGILYRYSLIDDAVAQVILSKGGFVWACKNYDGDVMSDMLSAAFGSLPMMTSVLVSPDGQYEYEAAHGTVTQHYYSHLRGEETSTNPVATIFAWTGALRKRGEMDGIEALCSFAQALEDASMQTLEDGIMTQDLSILCKDITPRTVTVRQMLREIRARLDKNI